jgi:hypothetical protein
MNPKHDGKARFRGQTARASDVQIKAFKFVLLEDLSGNVCIVQPKKFLLDTFVFDLWTYGSIFCGVSK